MRESAEKVLAFFVNSSIHVALAVTSLSLITLIEFQISWDRDLMFFIFFGAIAGYNFIKFGGFGRSYHRRLAKNIRIILIFSVVSIGALAYFALQLNFWVLLWSMLLGFLTLLYALPVFGRQRNLRMVGGVKVYIIAGIWSGVSVLLPVIHASLPITSQVGLELFQRFLFVLVLLLPFEIRDLKYDDVALKTIPQQIGIMKTKALGFLLLLLFVLVEMLQHREQGYLATVILVALVTAGMLAEAGKDQSRYYSSFWVEGIPLLWLVALILFRYLFYCFPPFVS